MKEIKCPFSCFSCDLITCPYHAGVFTIVTVGLVSLTLILIVLLVILGFVIWG